jgi:Domain of unknown function (DUF4410)
MQIRSWLFRIPFFAVAGILSSCASVSVKNVDTGTAGKPSQKPAHFDVRENTMLRRQKGALGSEVQQLLSKYLVQELSKNLAPASAVKVGGAPKSGGWLVGGEFTRVNEGNRLLRMGIGLGAGGTKMETKVAVRNLPASNAPFLKFATTGGSNATPGAATNPIPFSSAPTALLQSTQGVTDDAARTARMITATIADYMAKRGWVAAGAVKKPKMATQ